MNSKPKALTFPETYATSKGLEFGYTIYDHLLSDQEHNYRLYTIQVQHKEWGFRAFSVYVQKDKFPVEDVAVHLVRTLALDYIKSRLEEATSSGFPLTFLASFEGWYVL